MEGQVAFSAGTAFQAKGQFCYQMIVKPCITARHMLFEEIARDQPGKHWKATGLERSSFLTVLPLDAKYLYPNTPGGRSLEDLRLVNARR
jgi:hypothetical protein